jgi:hypothetical protein
MVAVEAAFSSDAFDGVPQRSNARADSPPVVLELLFTRSACPDASTQAREHLAVARKARQKIVQLGQFYLELPFSAARPSSENVKDELGAIDNLKVERQLKVAEL